MKKEGLILAGLCLILTIFFFSGIVSPSSDSSSTNEWLMFGRTLNHAAYDGKPFFIIPELNNATYPLCGEVLTQPIVVNGYVYISTGCGIYQLNASNVSQLIYHENNPPQGFGPVIAGDYLYLTKIISSKGVIYQINASDLSQTIATYTTPSGSSASIGSPIISGGYLYVGFNTAISGIFYQLDASDVSQEIASYSINDGFGKDFPAVADGYVYSGNSGVMHMFNANNVSQKISFETSGQTYLDSPAVANGYVYSGGNNIYQLNASDVSQIINKLAIPTCGSSPAIANGYVYIGTCGSSDSVLQLDENNVSKIIASYKMSGDVVSSPTVTDDYVYIGDYDGTFYQLDASDVSKVYANKTLQKGYSIRSTPAVANGYVYIVNDFGFLYQLNATNISLINKIYPHENVTNETEEDDFDDGGEIVEAPDTYCGDYICQELNDEGIHEDYQTCPSDCEEIEAGYICGDGICEGDETASNCKEDCGKPNLALIVGLVLGIIAVLIIIFWVVMIKYKLKEKKKR